MQKTFFTTAAAVIALAAVSASPAQARFLQTDPIGYEDQQNLYAYVHNDPINNVDPTGEECVNNTEAGTTNCVTENYDVTFDTPEGFQNTNPDAWDGHEYEVQGESHLSAAETTEWVANNPTPGNPAPASPGGTANDATPVIGGPGSGPNPVLSFTTTNQVTGNPVVVNATLPGHQLGNGVVIREVTPNANGSSTITNFGEGNGLLQSRYSPVASTINNVWSGQVPQRPAAPRSPYTNPYTSRPYGR